MANALILKYQESVQEDTGLELVNQGTQTSTAVAKEADDTDAQLISLGTSTSTRAAKEEATDSDPGRGGVSFVPRILSRRQKGLWY